MRLRHWTCKRKRGTGFPVKSVTIQQLKRCSAFVATRPVSTLSAVYFSSSWFSAFVYFGFASQNAKGHPSAVTMPVRNLWSALVRRKYYHSVTETKLERCLSVFDLTFLGVGSTLGLGIYVLAGQVASTKAGPAVTLSFMVAAFASIFSALCYAEFGARVPRAGSAYVYSYVTVGEFMAFIIGWNLILEYVIGTASVARGYSGYLDFLLNGTIKSHLTQSLPMSLDGLSSYPDFLALGITVLLTVMLALGVKESTSFNNVFTCSNLLVVLYAVITGSFKADVKNWKLNKSQIPADAGSGGFFPFGFSGMMSGASTCFYAYVGFDCIATTGEEAKNPQRAIPLSILVSLFIVFCAYFGISAIQTLMWPYYDQNQSAPLPYVFDQVGWPVAKWIISVGALAGLSTSDKFCFIGDDVPCHGTALVQEFLDSKDIHYIIWPACSADLNLIENVWDALGRNILLLAKIPQSTRAPSSMP